MTEVEPYERSEFGTSLDEIKPVVLYQGQLIEKEGVFIKQVYKFNNEEVCSIYYIPSRDEFVTSISNNKFKHFNIGSIWPSDEIIYRKMLNLNTNNNE